MFHILDDLPGVTSDDHHHHPDNRLAITIAGYGALTQHGREFNVADILDPHWGPVSAIENDGADIVEASYKPFTPD
jgi:hypothetical protein